ncbi:unnamed protein product [Chondrus crispus]|uniref:Uncharacterized protein n=1 Tax=Chondrus crispus TaxID=2769 RepID=R7Q733_CHOCR|nr:unnamed protein product [Chondrus crispus]CDF33280.1 unnamed protein product [Chondrus crispus]|eukprot:XP_005713083.1 unnamed protein product [Chondrus crispus]
MQDDSATAAADAVLVAAALERPHSHYAACAEQPDVAKALAQFSSERDIRKTGRLDLVTWVQYICGFGYPGPTDEAWAKLFAACRVLPMLATDSDVLREHEIAVLLAYAKIKPDNGDTMTSAQLVKHRIKPAVLGRTVARTPGILQHIHVKFENWALGPFSDMFCSYCVSLFGPSAYMPGIDDLPFNQSDIGDSIRECADAHANTNLKTWANVICNILDIEPNTNSPRAERFELKLHEKRKFMYQHIFIKISEHWFNLTQSRALIPQDRDSLHYREQPRAKKAKVDKLLPVRGKPDTQLCQFIKRVISVPTGRRTIPPWMTVVSHITICELHKPSTYGQAGLEFLQSDEVQTDLVKLVSPEQGCGFTPSRTNVRIGSFNSGLIGAEVCGVPPSQMCRALRLELTVGVLPPRAGSTRPRFEVTGIKSATWVELSAEEDSCEVCEPVSETMGEEAGQEEEAGTKTNTGDRLERWFGSSGIGKYLSLGDGCHWETYDLCEGMTKHVMRVTVPEDMGRRVRAKARTGEWVQRNVMQAYERERWSEESTVASECSGVDSSSSAEMEVDSGGAKTYEEPVWIDCHAAAKLTYIAPPGVELFAATPKDNSIFKNSPYWKARTP